jgi:prolyl 4-hydroxylase
LGSKGRRDLDAEWLGWLRTNVERGCAREELAQILRQQGFDDAAVRRAMEEVAARRAPPVAPGAARGAVAIPNARRFDSKLIELYTAEDFLGPEECAGLVARIKRALRPSTISTPPAGESDKAFRTSRTCDLIGPDAAITNLDAKVCAALGLEPRFAEPSQGQCYEVGQEFKAHTDFFKAYELEQFSTPVWGQRTWTFMIYLNEPEGGGETRFVDADLQLRPKLGMAVVWNNLLATGEPNSFTRHQGMPVTAGTKFVITKWFRMPPVPKPRFISRAVAWTQRLKA